MLRGYYNKNKERLSKKVCERYKIILKKKKRKGANMGVSHI